VIRFYIREHRPIVSFFCQTLFNSEEELNHYLKWNPAANAGLSFISFAGLSEQAEEVISGVRPSDALSSLLEVNFLVSLQLIRPNPIARYGIADLIGHPYFQRLDGFVSLSSNLPRILNLDSTRLMP
jgi:hypothetical protein